MITESTRPCSGSYAQRCQFQKWASLSIVLAACFKNNTNCILDNVHQLELRIFNDRLLGSQLAKRNPARRAGDRGPRHLDLDATWPSEKARHARVR